MNITKVVFFKYNKYSILEVLKEDEYLFDLVAKDLKFFAFELDHFKTRRKQLKPPSISTEQKPK
jgi:hypothetical protein